MYINKVLKDFFICKRAKKITYREVKVDLKTLDLTFRTIKPWWLLSSLYYFRAAFFKGQIEHPGSTRFRFRTINDDPVYIAVNTEGVSVIDMDDVVCNFGFYLS